MRYAAGHVQSRKSTVPVPWEAWLAFTASNTGKLNVFRMKASFPAKVSKRPHKRSFNKCSYCRTKKCKVSPNSRCGSLTLHLVVSGIRGSGKEPTGGLK
jgi:hypothetical protein